ncbi:hypothetical protein BC830DRAFT_1166757 [Chytriomyces sp. MP71]|nr:hypothetical protein BC830DRAFT_1166757 [Chytriomyces sp. MP71]
MSDTAHPYARPGKATVSSAMALNAREHPAPVTVASAEEAGRRVSSRSGRTALNADTGTTLFAAWKLRASAKRRLPNSDANTAHNPESNKAAKQPERKRKCAVSVKNLSEATVLNLVAERILAGSTVHVFNCDFRFSFRKLVTILDARLDATLHEASSDPQNLPIRREHLNSALTNIHVYTPVVLPQVAAMALIIGDDLRQHLQSHSVSIGDLSKRSDIAAIPPSPSLSACIVLSASNFEFSGSVSHNGNNEAVAVIVSNLEGFQPGISFTVLNVCR